MHLQHYNTIFNLVLDSLDDFLRDVYKETRYSYHTEWPPDQPKSVVSNTLIHYKDKRTERELLDMSRRQRGASSVDEMTSSHPSRVTKSITCIFESPDQRRFLIEGAPGIGKTVLVKEIAYRWACGETLLGKKLYLLFVRNPKLHDVDSINQQLVSSFSHDYLNDSEVDVAVHEIKKSRGLNIVFVIDGFDECPNGCQLQSFIEKLTKGDLLPKCMVVITSRPHASISLRPLADQRIEILGFAKKEREKYISESLQEFPDKEAELKKHLKLQPIINSVTHVPLHLAVLLYLFKEDIMPETLTELSEQFVIHTIYRHLEKQCQLPQLSKIERIIDLPKPILTVVYQLSKLAFSGFQNHRQKLVFTYDEVKALCPEVDTIPNGFGLLQAVKHHVVKGAGFTMSFNFLHLTIQEFLAAYYVSTLPNDEQLSVTFQDNMSEYVWLMYVGIVGVESDSFIKFKNNPTREVSLVTDFNSHSKLLFLFQCYLEAKCFTQFPQNIFEDGNICIEDEELRPYNILSLINFIVKSERRFISLVLSNCQITDEGMHILTEFFADHVEKISSIKCVDVDHNHITSLWGSTCDGSSDNHRSFMIPSFDLSSNILRDKGLIELSSALCYDTNLVDLDVSFNYVSDVGAIAISDCLKINCTLEELSMSHNRITDKGIKAISDSLKANNSLKALDISYNKVTTLGTKEIAGALKLNKMLTYLNISGNNVFDDGVSAISDSLAQNFTLRELNIASNTITNKGALEIAGLLKSNSTLIHLNASRNWIDKEGIMEILISRSLQTLECIFNTLSQSDFIAICDYVRKENAVKTLNASWNWITCSKDGSCTINTAMCYFEGHNVESCELHEHTTSLYDIDYVDFDYELLDKVIYCCIKDSFVKELCLSSWLMPITAEALQMNKSLSNIHITRSQIGVNEALAICKCLKVSTLKKLIISKCNLINQALTKIVDTIKCTKLRQLSILNIAISEGDVNSISNCLKQNTTLQELTMVHTKINDNGALMIAEAIQVNTTLLVLDVSYNQIAYKGAAAIGDSLRHNKRLLELNISYNCVTFAGVQHLAESIKTNTTLLEVHMMQCNRHLISVRINNTENGVPRIRCLNTRKMFLVATESNQLRQKVTIEGETLFDDKIMAIANCLQNNKILQGFKLSCCKSFGTEGRKITIHDFARSTEFVKERIERTNRVETSSEIKLSEIIEPIKQNRTLKTIAITQCRIGDEGAAIISDCITHNTSIRELDLSHNIIADEGAIKIFKSIEVNKVLQSLDVSYNEISDDGVLAASKCLMNNSTLLQLNIAHNKMRDDGVVAISDCVKVNTMLQQLSMTTGTISDITTDKFAEALTVNLALHTLTIENGKSNFFNDAILSAMYDNSTMMKLTLPSTITEEKCCVLRNEVERINMVRRSQEIDMLNVIFFVKDLSDDELVDVLAHKNRSYSSS